MKRLKEFMSEGSQLVTEGFKPPVPKRKVMSFGDVIDMVKQRAKIFSSESFHDWLDEELLKYLEDNDIDVEVPRKTEYWVMKEFIASDVVPFLIGLQGDKVYWFELNVVFASDNKIKEIGVRKYR